MLFLQYALLNLWYYLCAISLSLFISLARNFSLFVVFSPEPTFWLCWDPYYIFKEPNHGDFLLRGFGVSSRIQGKLPTWTHFNSPQCYSPAQTALCSTSLNKFTFSQKALQQNWIYLSVLQMRNQISRNEDSKKQKGS